MANTIHTNKHSSRIRIAAAITKAAWALLLLSAPISAAAQNADTLLKRFEQSFNQTVIYPFISAQGIAAAETMMKIEVSSNGRITSMQLSDSAPPALQKQFMAGLPKTDTAALASCIRLKGYPGRTLLMPVNIYVIRSALNPVSTLNPYLYQFNHTRMATGYILLPPLNNTFKVRVNY